MKLLVLILNKVELLEELLAKFADMNLNGATILQSTGMVRALFGYMDESFLGSLRAILDTDRDENRTILAVVREDQVAGAVEGIESVVGDLSEPDTGIVFTVPIDFIKGIHHEA